MKRNLLILFLMPVWLSAQTFTTSNNGTTDVDYQLNDAGYINTAMFVLYGDGYFGTGAGTLVSMQHRYNQPAVYQAHSWFARNKQGTPPALVSNPVGTGSVPGSYNNPQLNMNGNHVRLGASWLPVAGQECFTILTFDGAQCGDGGETGRIIFYYKTAQESFVDAIVYNSWLSNQIKMPSNDPDYDQMIIWAYAPIPANQQRHLYIKMKTDESAQLGTSIRYKAIKTSSCGEQSVAEFKINVAAYAHDPNSKRALLKKFHSICPQNGPQNVPYKILFHNDGDNFANNIVVGDRLDWRFDDPTFKLLSSKFPCVVKQEKNEILFNFDNINLPGLNQKYPYQYTYDETICDFDFSVDTRPCLDEGELPNYADIQFDGTVNTVQTNVEVLPIVPGAQCQLVCAYPYSNESTEQAAVFEKLSAAPNPFADAFTVRLPEGTDPAAATIDVFGAQGQLLFSKKGFSSGHVDLDAARWPIGTYIVRLRTEKGIEVLRVVKN